MPVVAQKVTVDIGKDVVFFMEGNDSILSYQLADKSMNGNYSRSNYIHPLYGLDGQVLTEDFPSDHPHHRGIFWAWHQLYAGDRRLGDSWELKNFSWELVSVNEIEIDGASKSVRSVWNWKTRGLDDPEDGEIDVVREITSITVSPDKGEYRQIDIEISLLALLPDLRIGGSEDEKGYGGFSQRIKLVDDITFFSEHDTVVPENTPVRAGKWMDFSGSMGKNGAPAGLMVLCHPENPGALDYWILRAAGSMQNAVYPYPGKVPAGISETDPTVLRYRLIIHRGDATQWHPEELYKDYIKL